MTTQAREDLFRYWPSPDDPEYAAFVARTHRSTEVLLERYPDLKEFVHWPGFFVGSGKFFKGI